MAGFIGWELGIAPNAQRLKSATRRLFIFRKDLSRMRKTTLAILALLSLALVGCGEKPEDKGEIKTTAAINNNAPGAADAPVAPRDPSIIMPGGGGSKKGGGAPKNPDGVPPPPQ